MKISILTIAPESFDSFLNTHVIRRAKELGVLELEIIDIRDFAKGSFRAIDDSPFGGGNGLILRCQPVLDAIDTVKNKDENAAKIRIAALAPSGRSFDQKKAHEYASEVSHLILVCGHYEGMDARIYDHCDELISIGDYIISGGELAAMVVSDAAARLLPGNLKAGSAEDESFENGLLEYPQYTQPADYKGEKVPEVLLSGNHQKIEAWRRQQSREITQKMRPDLL